MTTIDHITSVSLARLLRGYPTDDVDLSVVPDVWRALVGCVATANDNERLIEFESAMKAFPPDEANALTHAVFEIDPDTEPAGPTN